MASLRHPHIVSVLDYGFDTGRPFFTMEYLSQGHASGLLQATQTGSLDAKVALLAQIAQALGYLHRRGILHRDLKPANVLVVETKMGRHAKVLDFGLALERNLSVGTVELAGTLAYLAPELLLGAPPGEASDLYSLGMIACEIFSGGKHPLERFEEAGIGQLVNAILSLKVDTTQLHVPAALGELVARLLSYEPAERPSDAGALASEFYRAAGLPPPAEQLSIRESYLQAARFVSRKEEMHALLSALRNVLQERGGMILIGGESGVGKSRLLDELRTQALVYGAQVLRGQAVREGGGAFHVLRDVIEPLCLSVPLDDQALAVIGPHFPRLSGLLHRTVAAAPMLDAGSMQERTLAILLRLFETASANPQAPLVVLLEDLQWAGKESLSLLSRIAYGMANSALLVLGTYRNDEQPDLPMSVPDAEVLKLRRLDDSSIAALGEAMLGPGGKSEELVGFLARESEGNPFFIVETLRALAEEAGALHGVAQYRLPEHVLTGGVRAVLERRIRQVSAWAQPLLALAAVAGRQVEPHVLAHSDVAKLLKEQSVDTWLLHCADLSILEVRDQRWRFAHDKLRECLIEQVHAAGQKQELHREFAQALERAYPGAPDNDHALPLAQHLVAAVPLVSAERALSIALRAAEGAVKRLGFVEAAELLERAMAVVESVQIDQRMQYELFLALGQAQIHAPANSSVGRSRASARRGWHALSTIPVGLHKLPSLTAPRSPLVSAT